MTTAATAYIDPDDVVGSMPLATRPRPDSTEPDDIDTITRINSLCVSTAEMIDGELSRDFHRHPAAATDDPIEVLVDGHGSRVLHVHRGLISLESLEVRSSIGSAWSTIDEDDWELVSMFEAEGDRPYDHIQVARRLPTFPRGVRLTGHFGWAKPPAKLLEANIAWIRQHLAAGDSYSGAVQMPEGGYIPTPRLSLPDDVRILLNRETKRYQDCWT